MFSRNSGRTIIVIVMYRRRNHCIRFLCIKFCLCPYSNISLRHHFLIRKKLIATAQSLTQQAELVPFWSSVTVVCRETERTGELSSKYLTEGWKWASLFDLAVLLKLPLPDLPKQKACIGTSCLPVSRTAAVSHIHMKTNLAHAAIAHAQSMQIAGGAAALV